MEHKFDIILDCSCFTTNCKEKYYQCSVCNVISANSYEYPNRTRKILYSLDGELKRPSSQNLWQEKLISCSEAVIRNILK